MLGQLISLFMAAKRRINIVTNMRLRKLIYSYRTVYAKDFPQLIKKNISTKNKLVFRVSNNWEFGAFIVKIIPWINGLCKNGLHVELISRYSKAFVFFTTHHQEIEAGYSSSNKRLCRQKKENQYYELNILDFESYFLKEKLKDRPDYWIPPSYQEYYKNKEFVFEKPILIIQNKYNTEIMKYLSLYGKLKKIPVNYIPIELLEKIIKRYRNKYQIIYSRYTVQYDWSKVLDYGDFDLIKKKYPDVFTIQDLAKIKGLNFNQTQLKVYANCKRFIGVAGGGSWLCHYFGGKSLVLHIMPDDLYGSVLKGRRHYIGTTEIKKQINYYETIFPKLSNQEIAYARDIKTYGDLALEMF